VVISSHFVEIRVIVNDRASFWVEALLFTGASQLFIRNLLFEKLSKTNLKKMFKAVGSCCTSLGSGLKTYLVRLKRLKRTGRILSCL
jgi:hypothetical protein